MRMGSLLSMGGRERLVSSGSKTESDRAEERLGEAVHLLG